MDVSLPEKFVPLGLTFDDVLLLPAESDVVPSQASTPAARSPGDSSCPSRCCRRRWTR